MLECAESTMLLLLLLLLFVVSNDGSSDDPTSVLNSHGGILSLVLLVDAVG
jgi:hypothetical protein